MNAVTYSDNTLEVGVEVEVEVEVEIQGGRFLVSYETIRDKWAAGRSLRGILLYMKHRTEADL